MAAPRSPLPSSIPAVLPAALRLVRNVARGVTDGLLWPIETRIPRDWVAIRLDRGLTETAKGSWLDELRHAPRPLATCLDCLERAARDPQSVGVLLRVGRAPLGWAKTEALARALDRVRAARKRSVVYATHTGNGGAWLGARADRFWVAPEGRVDLVGVRLESPFVARGLHSLGVAPEVLAAGRYKAVGELLTRDGMSAEAREATEAVVERLYEVLLAGLAGRAGDRDTARRWVDGGPYLAREALEIGLVDAVLYPDELPAALASESPGEGAEPDAHQTPPDARLVGEAAYLRLTRRRFRWDTVVHGSPRIGVVPVTGFLREASVRPVVALLRRLERDESVRAVVLRVDSPGGEALAADLVWRAVGRVREQKPVVASLADTAASGGYYLAMAANEIVSEATTLTGSIGVASVVSLGAEGLLDRLGVSLEAVERGRHAGIHDPLRARSDEERELLQRQVESIYGEFVRKASEGRDMEPAAVDALAQGRVWAGADVLEGGLVDTLGGLDTAVERARGLAGLGAEEGDVVHLAPRRSPWQELFGPEPLETALGAPELWCPFSVPLR